MNNKELKDVECPYCGAGVDINHDDGYGYDENETHQQYCGNCHKNFVYETSISFYYEVSKAECLNDGNHDFKPTHSFPTFLTKMRCASCGEERIPTKEERKEFRIPTYEEYKEESLKQ
jgi:endogenous inhibitor of DNA gyrase (YacG/DUF329 family)